MRRRIQNSGEDGGGGESRQLDLAGWRSLQAALSVRLPARAGEMERGRMLCRFMELPVRETSVLSLNLDPRILVHLHDDRNFLVGGLDNHQDVRVKN